MNDNYVYLHTRTDDGIVFYVGQGHGNRAWVKAGRNPHWYRTVAKHAYTVELVYENLTKEQAAQLEIALIAKYREISLEKLTNLTSGGDGGMFGYSHQPESKEKIRTSLLGNTRSVGNTNRRGKLHSEEAKKKIKEKRALQAPTRLGQSPSEETREKLRQANLGKTYSKEVNIKKGAANKGKPRNPDLVAKTAAGNMGKTRTPEQKEKMRLAQLKVPRKGKPLSQETRDKMSLAARARSVKN